MKQQWPCDGEGEGEGDGARDDKRPWQFNTHLRKASAQASAARPAYAGKRRGIPAAGIAGDATRRSDK